MHASPQLETDTIVALATPQGRGGIGVVRLSGPAALAIARHLVRLLSAPIPRRATYGDVVDAAGRRLDDALLTWFAAPGSYTGEDVVEISTHGSPVVLQTVVEAAVQWGARPARAGEFTERAYLAGKLDLTAAEAVRDLIDAQTVEQARLAAQQLGGSLAREIAPVKIALVSLIAAMEAGIDFTEDDLDTLSGAEIAARIAPLLPPLDRLEASFTRGRAMREGLRLAIVGEPNAGKSSLFNRLVGRDRAIVTPVAGTTRDVVSEPLVLGGIPLHLLDTAGLRDTTDAVERIGIERTYEAIADADLVLHVIDATGASPQPREPGIPSVSSGTAVLTVFTKADLLAPHERACLPGDLQGRPSHAVAGDPMPRAVTAPSAPADALSLGAPMLVSATTGEGIEDLQRRIIGHIQGSGGAVEGATLTSVRQHAAVLAARDSLHHAHAESLRSTPHELLLLSLYSALQSLDALTGTTTPDDVLHLIFSTFCIGK